MIFDHIFIEHLLGAKHERRYLDITTNKANPCPHEDIMRENSNKQVSTHVICQLSIMPMEKQQHKYRKVIERGGMGSFCFFLNVVRKGLQRM